VDRFVYSAQTYKLEYEFNLSISCCRAEAIASKSAGAGTLDEED
jgi:hypothetical protein